MIRDIPRKGIKINGIGKSTRPVITLAAIMLMLLNSTTVAGQNNTFNAFQQNDSIAKQDLIGLSTKAYDDSIVLRWAPNSRAFWQSSRDMGYVVIRLTHRFEDQIEKRRVLDSLYNIGDSNYFVKLRQLRSEIRTKGHPIDTTYLATFEQPIKPYDSAQWVPHIAEMDDYAHVAAAAALGQLSVADSTGFATKAQQEKSLFGITLMAADFSSLAADGLGLRFVDKSVEFGRFYEYVVLPAEPAFNKSYHEMDSVTQAKHNTFLSNQEGVVVYRGKEVNAQVAGLSAMEGEQLVTLNWPAPLNRFSGYWVLRSEDGGITFDSLNQKVFIPQQKQQDNGPALYEFKDSLLYNYVPYHYRLIGVDGFAEFTDPVDISAMGRDRTPPKNPVLQSASYQGPAQNIALRYSLPEITEVDQFKLIHATDEFFLMNVEQIALNKADSSYIFQPESDSYFHYFKLEVADTALNISQSHPLFVHIPDTIPPAVPQDLSAKIDSIGNVQLQWSDATVGDKGFLGYRVYYGNDPKHEFTQLTSAPLKSNALNYQIPLNTLTETIYYKVQSVDGHYNHSEFSGVIEARKPDHRPPASPVFNPPRSTKKAVLLSWSPSSSKDVVKQVLVRSQVGSEATDRFELGKATTQFTDTTAAQGRPYEYRLIAVDDANNQSKASLPVRAQIIRSRQLPPVSDVKASYAANTKEVRLEWDYEQQGDFRFVIYRGLSSEGIQRYKTLDPGQREMLDAVKQPGRYTYAIKVIHKNGSRSLLSEPVSVSAN